MPTIDSAPPLVLTARMDDAAFSCFDKLRRRHFPPERNFLDAHITLFHKLPGVDEAAIARALRQACADIVPVSAWARNVRFLGRGVAIGIEASGLVLLRSNIADLFRDALSAQDRQPFRPHVTIQNKADPERARTLHGKLSEEFVPFRFEITGLVLWRYRGGPWERLETFEFVTSG